MTTLPYTAGGSTPGVSGGAVVAGTGAMIPTIATPIAIVLTDWVELNAGVSKQVADGITSERQDRAGMLRDIYVPCTAGIPFTLAIECQYAPDADPRPRLILRANPAVGIADDIIGDAPAGSGWNTLTVTAVPTEDGVVQVWRQMRSTALGAYALWTNLRMTE